MTLLPFQELSSGPRSQRGALVVVLCFPLAKKKNTSSFFVLASFPTFGNSLLLALFLFLAIYYLLFSSSTWVLFYRSPLLGSCANTNDASKIKRRKYILVWCQGPDWVCWVMSRVGCGTLSDVRSWDWVPS